MNKSTSNVVAFADPPVEKDALTELIRQGAQQLLSRAIEIELEERMAELQAVPEFCLFNRTLPHN